MQVTGYSLMLNVRKKSHWFQRFREIVTLHWSHPYSSFIKPPLSRLIVFALVLKNKSFVHRVESMTDLKENRP